MKKALVILLSAAMVLSLAACGSDSGTTTTAATTAEETTTAGMETTTEEMETTTEAVTTAAATTTAAAETTEEDMDSTETTKAMDAVGATEADAAAGNGAYTPGTYTGSATGMGKIEVTVTVDETSITEVEIVGDSETAGIGKDPIDNGTYQDMIMEAQSSDIDSISGATVTTKAVIKALDKALAQARGEE